MSHFKVLPADTLSQRRLIDEFFGSFKILNWKFVQGNRNYYPKVVIQYE